jgi:hypothetical protein
MARYVKERGGKERTMNTRQALSAISILVLGAALMVPAAKAGPADQLTKFTFDQPVEVSGMVLAPGTYWFKVWDDVNNETQNMIEIYDVNFDRVGVAPALPIVRRSEGYGTAIPDHAMDRVELRITDGSAQHPATLLSWFYPYGFSGHHFVYSGREEKLLSEESSHVVALNRNSSSDGITYGD